jgi:hypothetical protein
MARISRNKNSREKKQKKITDSIVRYSFRKNHRVFGMNTGMVIP